MHPARVLCSHGVSAEFWPLAVKYAGEASDAIQDAATLERMIAADEFAGNWNLQADATGARFMDFSDFFALPRAPLHPAWRMSEQALQHAFALEKEAALRSACASPLAARRLCGDHDEKASVDRTDPLTWASAMRRTLSGRMWLALA